MNNSKEIRIDQLMERVQLHADSLKQDGVGVMPTMVRTSLFELLKSSPDLPALYEADARDFASLANRIAPPDLMAEHTRLFCEVQSTVLPIPMQKTAEIIDTLIMFTSVNDRGKSDADRGKNQLFRYTPEEMRDFLSFTAEEPDLELSSIYAIPIHQAFIESVMRMMEEKSDSAVGSGMEAFKKHFNATNFVNRIPIALRIAHVRTHGADAPASTMDAKTMADAMQFLHGTGQFEMVGRNPSNPGEVARIRCPMAGYLQRLLVTHDGFMPVLRATERMTDAAMDNARSGTLTPAQELHIRNRQNMRVLATAALRKLEGR